VHETLSHTQDETVAFDTVADRVIAMATEVSTEEATVRPRRRGRFGMLPAQVATPLAMVLTELLQNALEHGLKDGPGELIVSVERLVGRLRVVVADTGVGLPDDFDPEESSRLGLQIVRTLVTVELGGTFDIGTQPGGGTRVIIDIPLPGTPVAAPHR
ncbi:MAG TPA: ATP-binding protein, partial [Actinomycetes bacterium]|nr:ATP-binding protein [Actinomycetes bacterium]